MESKTILITVLVAALGIAACVAGFAAEVTKVKKNQPTLVVYYMEVDCVYPSRPAMGLAIAATVALVLARAIITSSTGGCCSCCDPIPSGPKFGGVFIIISWVTSVIAVALFVTGAKLSTRESPSTDENGVYHCYVVRPGIFAGGGIMGLVSVLLGLVYYFLYILARSRAAAKKSSVDPQLEIPPIADGMLPREPLSNH